MSESFDRAPGAGRGRGRGRGGTAPLSGADASESGGGARLGGSGSHSSGSAEEQQHQTGGLFPQQEPLRPPKTAPLGTGIAGTGRRAAAPSPPLRRPSVSKVSGSSPLKPTVLRSISRTALLLRPLSLRLTPPPSPSHRDWSRAASPSTSLRPGHGIASFPPPHLGAERSPRPEGQRFAHPCLEPAWLLGTARR